MNAPLPYGSSTLEDETTLTESGFRWREHDGVKILTCRGLESAGFVNGFSTRLGGVSPYPSDDLNLAGFGEDTDENIAENRRRFLLALGGNFNLVTAWQVHGSDVRAVITQADAKAAAQEKFDALIATRSQILLGVKTADCVPILIGDPKTGAFGAIHAGWRGTINMITKNAVEKMASEFGSSPSDLIAAVGPAAGKERYEVGPEVIDALRANFAAADRYLSPTRSGHALIDLKSANRDLFVSLGLLPENIFTAPFCTMSRTDLFFSYRVEKPIYGKVGRLMAVIGHDSGHKSRFSEPLR